MEIQKPDSVVGVNEDKNEELKQFVVFRLGSEEYGLDINMVTTIERVMSIARVPKTLNYIKGVINLRGEIIPLINLRTRFNMPEAEETEDSRVIIIKIGENSVGILVDSVAEVIQLRDEDIENITDFSSDLSIDYIFGVGKKDKRIVTLLSLEKLIKIDN